MSDLVEMETRDGRRVTLEAASDRYPEGWVRIVWVNVNGLVREWAVPGEAVAEFLEGICEGFIEFARAQGGAGS